MENRPQSQYTEFTLLILLAFLWGSSFTLIKIAVETVSPATTVLLRVALGAALLLLVVRVKGIALPTSPTLWAAFALQGFLQSALPFTLISWGETYIDSGLAGLLNSTPPLFAFLITFFILKQSAAPMRNFMGVLIGFSGVITCLGPEVLSSFGENFWAQIAVTGSSLSYAVAALYARRFSDQPVLVTAAGSMTMAMLIMLPISLYVDEPWTLNPSNEALLSIAMLGIFSTALAMIIYFHLVKTLGPIGVTSGSYLRAGFSLMLGVIFLEEFFSTRLLVGLILILFSVAIVTGQANILLNKALGRWLLQKR